MNLLQTIWSVLTTPNELLTNLLVSPLVIVETTITVLIFCTLLNIQSTLKSKSICIFALSFLALISRFFLPAPYSAFINIFFTIIIIMLIFKLTLLKSIFAELLPFVIVAILETIITKFYSVFLHMPFELIITVPIHRLCCLLLIYLVMFILYMLLKHFKLNILFFDSINKKTKSILIINSIFALITIGTQFYIIVLYLDILPSFIVLLNLLSLISYISVSLYNLANTTKLEIVNTDLEETKMYNKTLNILHDNIRGFKHDFGNIIQTIGGYVATEDIKGLKKYYSQLLDDCQRVNNLAALNPTTINNPAIYSLLASKYYVANEQGITINLEVLLDLNEINMKIYEFTRVLGILLDNAIEASSQCNEKVVNISFRNNEKKNMQEIIIQNTYNNKDVNIDAIFQKGYTSKTSENENSHGLGLWEIRQILKKRNNLNLYTTKSEKYFTQQLEIYL